MAVNRLRIQGLETLQAELRNLAPALVREATGIVHSAGETAMRSVAAAYPVITGELRGGLRLELRGDGVSATARVINVVPWARAYDRGSPPRHWQSGKSTGRAPARKVFGPAMGQQRLAMRLALIELVERSGLTVKPA